LRIRAKRSQVMRPASFADPAVCATTVRFRLGSVQRLEIAGDAVVGVVTSQLATQRRVLVAQCPVPKKCSPNFGQGCKVESALLRGSDDVHAWTQPNWAGPGGEDHAASGQDRRAGGGAGFSGQGLRSLSVDRRRGVIDPQDERLSVVHQCALVGIARSSLYYRPAAWRRAGAAPKSRSRFRAVLSFSPAEASLPGSSVWLSRSLEHFCLSTRSRPLCPVPT